MVQCTTIVQGKLINRNNSPDKFIILSIHFVECVVFHEETFIKGEKQFKKESYGNKRGKRHLNKGFE